MLNNFYTKVFIVLLLVMTGCQSKKESTTSNWEIKPTAQQLSITQIGIDTVFVNLPKFSYLGFWKMDGSQLLYFDKMYGAVSIFDKIGKFVSTPLPKGKGPREIDSWCKNGSNNVLFEGCRIYQYDSKWQKIKVSSLNTDSTISKKELIDKPKASYLEVYEVKYFQNNHTMLDSTHVLFNIESPHPKFNGYFSAFAKAYYQQANIFARVNINTGKWEKNLLHYSDYYVAHPNVANFSNWSYDMDASKLYLNFDADSLIYVYDKQLKPLYAFGRKGVNMNQKYIETTTYKEAIKVFSQERAAKGFYSTIKRIAKLDLTFRCYTTGNSEADIFDDDDANNRRMQIYKGTVLVGDVQVPSRFNIIGYDENFIYADGYLDESNEKLAFYKFKIPTL